MLILALLTKQVFWPVLVLQQFIYFLAWRSLEPYFDSFTDYEKWGFLFHIFASEKQEDQLENGDLLMKKGGRIQLCDLLLT